jgi:Cft2 family RNA processing exonuclease
MTWQIRQLKHGIHLPQIDWWLDAHKPVPRSIVSHAHFDHLAAHDEILCTPATARLARARLRGHRIEHTLPFGHTEQLTPDSTITLHPAGHIRGSAQCLIDHATHGTLLYTGDFKLRPGRSAEPCVTPRADTLIMETTFGNPRYVFPPTEKILADITTFCRGTLAAGANPILYGYSLGKSQEILSHLADARLPLMLHEQTARMTRVYETLGIAFPPHAPFDPDPRAHAGHVIICPPQPENSAFLQKIPARRTAMISGWAIDASTIHRMRCDAAFPLSDHADYNDLLRYVDLVRPRLVYTTHGHTAAFAKILRDRGTEAWPLDKDTQLDLSLGSLP